MSEAAFLLVLSLAIAALLFLATQVVGTERADFHDRLLRMTAPDRDDRPERLLP